MRKSLLQTLREVSQPAADAELAQVRTVLAVYSSGQIAISVDGQSVLADRATDDPTIAAGLRVWALKTDRGYTVLGLA